MPPPADHSAHGPQPPPTTFRQLRAILGSASGTERGRTATRPPDDEAAEEAEAEHAAHPDDVEHADRVDDTEAEDVGREAAGTNGSTVAAHAAEEESGEHDGGAPGSTGSRNGSAAAGAAGSGAAAPVGSRGRDDGGARDADGEGVDPGGTTLTSDDVLDLMGGDEAPDGQGPGQGNGQGNGTAPRARGGWLLPARTGPGTDLEPGDDLDEGDEADFSPAVRPRRLRDRRYRRRHGVAPFVQPSARRSRRKRRRDYRKLGFIELTQEKLRLRHRIFPRTVLGVSAMILAFGIGAALSGATLYAYYDYRLSQNEASVETFASGFDDVFASAIGQLNGVRDQAVSSVNNSLGPLQEWQNDANAVVDLPGGVGNGVWTLRSSDTAGRPVIGSAFVVSSDASSSLLLTAHELVAAATAQPGPRVTLEKGAEQLAAEVWSWDPEHDLALVKLPKGNLPAITWAPEAVRAAAVGTRVYAMSGLGGTGAKAVSGMVIDVSNVGLQHNVQLSPDFRGGPLVTAQGQVLAVATSTYRPLGFDPGPLPYAPDVTTACQDQKVLVCPAALTGQR